MNKCPYCGAIVELKDATYIYHKSQAKSWGKMWVCSNYPKCNSYVGCHKGTTLPLGRLANERLRTLKMEAHKQFDPIWKSGLLSRKEAYKWLADMLDIPQDECHIGMFDIKMCQKVIHLCRQQNNPIINSFREKEGIRSNNIFTRGYTKRVPK